MSELYRPSDCKGMRTKHTCAYCGDEFVVEHWSDSKGQPATMFRRADGRWFGPYCCQACRTADYARIYA